MLVVVVLCMFWYQGSTLGCVKVSGQLWAAVCVGKYSIGHSRARVGPVSGRGCTAAARQSLHVSVCVQRMRPV